jgi:hypothetical protein
MCPRPRRRRREHRPTFAGTCGQAPPVGLEQDDARPQHDDIHPVEQRGDDEGRIYPRTRHDGHTLKGYSGVRRGEQAKFRCPHEG